MQLQPYYIYDEEGKIAKDEQGNDLVNPNADLDAEGNIILEKDENGNIKKVSYGISSLNDYFHYIRELASLAIGEGTRTGSDPYFLRLPLDEPFMEINANTRLISVPSELSQISVVGDKYAEVVFFKIDRYFDAVDLNTRHIYIEWEHSDGTKGVSRDFLRDTQSEKDKIIFGWIIGDEMTRNPGTIRFAVRFVEWNHDAKENPDEAVSGTELAYSFSSLPAQIGIADTLQYSLFTDATDVTEKIDTAGDAGTILFYLEPSALDSADETAPEPASIPQYIINLRSVIGAVAKEGIYEANLDSEGKLVLNVEAYASEDSGNISYMFGRKDYKDTGTEGIIAKIDFPEVELAKNHDVDNDNSIYYADAGNGTFVPLSNTEIKAALADLDEEENETFKCHKKIAFMIATKPGYYFANARNSVSGRQTSSANSDMLYIPYAETPTVTAMEPHFVKGKVEYALEAQDPENWNGELSGNVGKTNVHVTYGTAGSTIAHLAPVATKSDGGTLVYSWYKHKADYEALERGKFETLAEWYVRREKFLTEDKGWTKLSVTTPTYDTEEPGCYLVVIENHFNNDNREAKLLASGVCRVTEAPKLPTVLWEEFDEAVADKTRPIPTFLRVSQRAYSEDAIEEPFIDFDSVEYEWHRITEKDSYDLEVATGDDMASVSGPVTFDNEGFARISFIPRNTGFYYLVLKVHLNDATIIGSSLDMTAPREIYIGTQPITDGE